VNETGTLRYSIHGEQLNHTLCKQWRLLSVPHITRQQKHHQGNAVRVLCRDSEALELRIQQRQNVGH